MHIRPTNRPPQVFLVLLTLLSQAASLIGKPHAMQGANGPVHTVLSENWVVYTYWSRAAHRFQSTVVELYDASPRSLSAAQLVLGSANSTVSSYRPVQLEVCMQTSPSEAQIVTDSRCACKLLRGSTSTMPPHCMVPFISQLALGSANSSVLSLSPCPAGGVSPCTLSTMSLALACSAYKLLLEATCTGLSGSLASVLHGMTMSRPLSRVLCLAHLCTGFPV